MKHKISLDLNKCDTLVYKHNLKNEIVTCFYTKTKNKVKRQFTSFRQCRELVINDVVYNTNGIDKQRLKLLMSGWSNELNGEQEITNKIRIGANIANIVSKKFNMQPVICKNVSQNTLQNTSVMEITASPKWQRSPHMLSLFLMFTKYCNSYEFKNIKTYEELCDVLDKTEYITNNLMVNSKHITFFLSNYDKLFRNLPMAENYKIQSYYALNNSYIQYDGITRLITRSSAHKILNKRFFKLLEK